MKLTRNVLATAAVTGIAAALLLFSSSSPADAKGKPGGGGGVNLASFTFAFDGSGSIYVTTMDDSNRVKIASSKGGKLESPTWSPDLSPDPGYQGLIAYLDFQSDSLDLYVTDGNQSQLVRSFTVADPFPSELDSDVTLAWTPTGQEIVFVSASNLIVAVELATGNHRVLLDFSGDLGPDTQDVTISPVMIAYSRRGDIWAAGYQINGAGLIEVDATSTMNLTNTPDTGELACSFSRDGTYLSYSRLVDHWEIVVLDLLTMEETLALDGLSGWREVAWSPDGSELCIYNVEQLLSGNKIFDLFRITHWDDPANRTVIQVTADRNQDELHPDWRPPALGN